jgi:hypothetical protein
VGCPHGQIPGIDFIPNSEGAQAGRAPPGTLIQLIDSEPLITAARPQSHDILGKFADHVTSRYPGGQGKYLPGGIGILDGATDFKKMGARLFGRDLKPNRGNVCHIVRGLASLLNDDS